MVKQSQKKIALLHYAYPPNTGGVEKVIYQQALFLNAHNFDVIVLTGEGKESNANITLLQIPELQSVMNQNPNLQKKILQEGIIDSEFYKLATTIEDKISSCLNSVTHIIVHNMMTLSWNLPFAFAFSRYIEKHPEKKVLIWVHDHMLVSTKGIEGTYHPKSPLEETLLTTPIKNVTYILVSNTFKKYFCQLMHVEQDNVVVIPNGISIPEFLNLEDSVWNFIKEKQIESSFPIIFSPVNLMERKNIEYSLELLHDLKITYPHALYLISGHPSIHRETQSYVDLLKKKVSELDIGVNTIFLWDIFHRTLTDSEIYSIYRIVDIIFYFSKSENFGLPLLESALAKTPIVTSNLEVFHEIAGKNLTAIDSNTISVTNAASQIAHMIDENATMQYHYTVRKEYNLETILKTYLLPLLET